MMAFGTRSWIVCRTIEKYELMRARMRDVSISSRSVRPFELSCAEFVGDDCIPASANVSYPKSHLWERERRETHSLQMLVQALHVERRRAPLEPPPPTQRVIPPLPLPPKLWQRPHPTPSPRPRMSNLTPPKEVVKERLLGSGTRRARAIRRRERRDPTRRDAPTIRRSRGEALRGAGGAPGFRGARVGELRVEDRRAVDGRGRAAVLGIRDAPLGG